MALAVCVLFDRAGDRAIRELWERLEAEGVPTLLSLTHGHHRAHLSYAVALEWARVPASSRTTRQVSKQPSPRVRPASSANRTGVSGSTTPRPRTATSCVLMAPA